MSSRFAANYGATPPCLSKAAAPITQHGTSLIELLVGLLIGVVAAVAILQTFAAAESRKRNTTAMAEAQQTGRVAMFTLASELANAGNGISAATAELGTCPDTG